MNASALSEFERLLGDETSPWFEYNLEMASESLSAFVSEDWRGLQSKVLSFSACVQERCAEAVGDFGSNDGVAALTTLLASSPYLDVAAIAASQLDDMEIELPLSLRGKLQQLLDQLMARHSTRAEDVQRLISHLC
ncbi:hypothetical protein SAMN05518865_11325 [Duganella sp. CF458]|nr:hypothetical protein SAMN05518865_11325 [Duganella sp. CF458]